MKEKTTGESKKPREIANDRERALRETRERESPTSASTGRDEKMIGAQRFPRKGDDEDAP